MLLAHIKSIGFVPRRGWLVSPQFWSPCRVSPYGGVADTEDLAKRTVSLGLPSNRFASQCGILIPSSKLVYLPYHVHVVGPSGITILLKVFEWDATL
jgi:hypothetical protein